MDEGLKEHKTRKSVTSLPVTPSYQYSSSKDKKEGHVRDPHDDSHGIHTKDCPRRGERGRHRFRAAGIGAVLAGAGFWTVLQALSTGICFVVHGSITRHWDILVKKKQYDTAGWVNELWNCFSTTGPGPYTQLNYLPENIGIIGKGVCPLLMSNIYWIQLVALQSFASFPHSSDKAFTLLDGAWTSLQALYMAKTNGRLDCFTENVDIS